MSSKKQKTTKRERTPRRSDPSGLPRLTTEVLDAWAKEANDIAGHNARTMLHEELAYAKRNKIDSRKPGWRKKVLRHRNEMEASRHHGGRRRLLGPDVFTTDELSDRARLLAQQYPHDTLAELYERLAVLLRGEWKERRDGAVEAWEEADGAWEDSGRQGKRPRKPPLARQKPLGVRQLLNGRQKPVLTGKTVETEFKRRRLPAGRTLHDVLKDRSLS